MQTFTHPSCQVNPHWPHLKPSCDSTFSAKSGLPSLCSGAIPCYNCPPDPERKATSIYLSLHFNICFNVWNIACGQEIFAEKMVIRFADIRGLKLEIIHFCYYMIFPWPVIFTINYSCDFCINMNRRSIIVNSSAN